MIAAQWLEFTIRPRWPDPGFVIEDQHGHEHARGSLVELGETIQTLRAQQDEQLQSEGAWK
jgi:hypothetical protein